MKTRSKTRRAKQLSALYTDPKVNGSCSINNIDLLQQNGDVLDDRNEFVSGLPDNTGSLQVILGKRYVPYKIKKRYSNQN